MIGVSLRSTIAISLVMAMYYGFLLTNGDFDFFLPAEIGLTFNSMLLHMLDGRFDVDPDIILKEGYLRDGRVYAYWGPFCALLRLPLLLLPNAMGVDITRLSCLAGVCTGLFFKLRSLALVARHSPESRQRTLLVMVFGAWLLFGGAQTGFLRASIYQEVLFWSNAMAAIFVYVAILGVLRKEFSIGILSAMAAAAGFAIDTRISTGMGLTVAFGAIIPLVWQESKLSRKRLPIPLAVLGLLIMVAGIVNFGRWGNPLTFADFNGYIPNHESPDRLTRMHAYGLFNVERLPLGIVYYFLPFWMLSGADGQLLLAAYRFRLIDAAELPPGSFLLTDLLPIVALFMACRHPFGLSWRSATLRQTVTISAGLAVPIGLMLTAISMSYRYRMEFYPLLEFAGLLAIPRLAAAGFGPGFRKIAIATMAIGIVAAQAELLLYKMSPYGPGEWHLHNGIVELYRWSLLDKPLE